MRLSFHLSTIRFANTYFLISNLLLLLNNFLSTHADRQGVDISFTVCVCCLFVCLPIFFPARIKLVIYTVGRKKHTKMCLYVCIFARP